MTEKLPRIIIEPGIHPGSFTHHHLIGYKYIKTYDAPTPELTIDDLRHVSPNSIIEGTNRDDSSNQLQSLATSESHTVSLSRKQQYPYSAQQ